MQQGSVAAVCVPCFCAAVVALPWQGLQMLPFAAFYLLAVLAVHPTNLLVY
jgi:hypothetical protein